MKPRIQFTPSLTVALACSGVWFAFWLVAFRPAPAPLFQPKPRPQVALHPVSDTALRTLQAPTLFALPSKNGFSGTFPEDRVNIRLSLERPHRPETYLPRPPVGAAAPDLTLLLETIPLLGSKTPSPIANRTVVIRRPEQIELFFSPILQDRAPDIEPLQAIKSLPSASIRIHLTVRPDGTIAHTFFETPTEQPALLSAVRKIRFTPAPEAADGWLDIRFTPPGEETGEPN